MESIYYYDSPIGRLRLLEENGSLTALEFADDELLENKDENKNVKKDSKNGEKQVAPTEFLRICKIQLDEYFAGSRKDFDLACTVHGTVFQKEVWNALTTIPYAKTASYKDIAVFIKREKAMRAVGNANHNNPISIIIPCHRVIGMSGKMVGYGGGIWRKEWLLAHEKKNA